MLVRATVPDLHASTRIRRFAAVRRFAICLLLPSAVTLVSCIFVLDADIRACYASPTALRSS